MNSESRYWSALFALGVLCWGTSFFWIKIALLEIGPFEIVSLRLLICSLLLWMFVLLGRRRVPSGAGVIAKLIVVGIVSMTLPFLFVCVAETRITSSVAGIINGTAPLFTMVLAAVSTREENFTGTKFASLAVGFAGLLFVTSSNAGVEKITDGVSHNLIMLAVPMCYAIGGVLTRLWLKDLQPLVTATVSVTGAMVATMALQICMGVPVKMPTSPTIWAAMLWMGAVSTAFAYILYFYLIQNWGASRASLVSYMSPVSALILGANFLGESFDWRVIAGVILILASVFFASPRAAQLAASSRSWRSAPSNNC